MGLFFRVLGESLGVGGEGILGWEGRAVGGVEWGGVGRFSGIG